MMKRVELAVWGLLCSVFGAWAQLSFSGNALPAVKDTPVASTGLAAVFTLDNTAGVRAEYSAASSSATVNWYRFSNLGGGYAEPVASQRDGTISSILLDSSDMGYIIEEGDRRTCVWVVNYANHPCSLGSLSIAPEQDCMMAALSFNGQADRIVYYSINGAAQTLSRGITVEFANLVYDADKQAYRQEYQTKSFDYLSSEIHIPSPLCDTEFLLTGDRFQIAWHRGRTIESPTYRARAVEAVTSATQTLRQIDNEQRPADTNSGSLGGSAPVEITFEAAVTDAAIYREWQYAFDPAFEEIDMRVAELTSTHTFTEYGTTYVRFVCGDNSGSCTWTSETYTVNVGESRLECPNAFSPGSSEGVNDQWKVSYKSIVKFDCHIFNRWGNEVAHLTDPSQGWDGRYNGKLVKSGVFYYVIQAEGADGKHYKLAGDINIIHMSRSATP